MEPNAKRAAQADAERNPNYVPDRDIEARIKRVAYESTDYKNATLCTIWFDNDVRVFGIAHRNDDDIARTQAYDMAIDKARIAFEWALADHKMNAMAQISDSTELLMTGKSGGD